MKILIQNRVDAFTKMGGDTIQIARLKESLVKLGTQVDISCELFPELDKYDIIHIFNITRVHDAYLQCMHAKRHKKKIVLTPLHHDIGEIEDFEKNGRYGPLKYFNRLIYSPNIREMAKNIYRGFICRDQRYPVFRQLFIGYRRQQLEVLKMADLLLPLAQLEMDSLFKDFGIRKDYEIVHNGVKHEFLKGDGNRSEREYGIRDFVACVARIEPRKNQLNLIKAMDGLNIDLVLVGGMNPNNKEYNKEVRRLAALKPWIHHVPHIDHEKIADLLAAAKVHALPSWFEVVSLSCLEAALAGCNIVMSDRGYTREYIGEKAWYCDPESIDSIRKAVVGAYGSPKNDGLREIIKQKYTWENAAQEALGAYRKALANP